MTHGERIGLFEVKIACMTEKHQVEFEQILREYLPGSEPETVREKAENYSETCLVALKDEKVIGIAFGWPREAALPRKEYCLEGLPCGMSTGEKVWEASSLRHLRKACESTDIESFPWGLLKVLQKNFI
jgi:hypothetical protein